MSTEQPPFKIQKLSSESQTLIVKKDNDTKKDNEGLDQSVEVDIVGDSFPNGVVQHEINMGAVEEDSKKDFPLLNQKNEEIDSFEDLIPGTDLLKKQKAAIWAQMQHYRRLSLELDEDAKAKLKQVDDLYSVFDRFALKVSSVISDYLIKNGIEFNEIDDNTLPTDMTDLTVLNSTLRSTVSRIWSILGYLTKTNPDSIQESNQEKSFNHLISENIQLKGLIDRKLAIIDKLKEEVSLQTTHRLVIERRLDRLRANQAINGNVLGPTETSNDTTNASASKQSSINNESSQADNENKIDESLKIIADKRLEDLLLSKQKYNELLEEKDKLTILVNEIKLNTTSLLEYPEYKKLQAENNFLFGENGVLKEKLEKLSTQIEQLESSRQSYKTSIEEDHKEQLHKLKSVIAKLNDDLDRIRTQRDQLESKNLEYVKKEKTQIMSHNSIVQLSEARLLLIDSLKKKIERLLNDNSKLSNSNELVKFLIDNFDELDTEKLKEELVKDKERINQLVSLLEKNGINEDGSTKESKIDTDLETKINKYEKNFEMFTTEVENITQAYNKVEKTNHDAVEQLKVLESTVTQLRAEKDEISKRYANQNKLLYTKQQSITNLNKLQEKQLEQIKLLIQSEKNLKSQITLLESTMAAQKHVYDKYQLELTESTRLLQEYKTRNNELLIESKKVEEILKGNRQLYEEETAKRQALEEKVTVLQSKLDNIVGTGSGTEVASLKKELEHWKLCLKCSSCTTNFKSHVLLRCMHVFCKNCIENMYESRQRKCPSCGIQFGRNDIKQVFL